MTRQRQRNRWAAPVCMLWLDWRQDARDKLREDALYSTKLGWMEAWTNAAVPKCACKVFNTHRESIVFSQPKRQSHALFCNRCGLHPLHRRQTRTHSAIARRNSAQGMKPVGPLFKAGAPGAWSQHPRDSGVSRGLRQPVRCCRTAKRLGLLTQTKRKRPTTGHQ